jgi:hypothetical protein
MKHSPLRQRAGDEWARTAVLKYGAVSRQASTVRLLAAWVAALGLESAVLVLTRFAEYGFMFGAG